MTHKEMSEIFAVMLLAYPNAEVFKGGIAKLGPTINLWVTCLPEIDFWTGQQAVVKLVRECKFPPTIAEFKEKAEKVQAEVRRGSTRRGITSSSIWTLGKRRRRLWQDCRRERISGASLRLWVALSVDCNRRAHLWRWHRKDIRVLQLRRFQSAYETIIRQTSALNSGPRKAVGPGISR